MIHAHGVSIAAVVVSCDLIVLALLGDSLGMGMLVCSMMSLLLLMVTLLLVHPGLFLWVLVLVREHMMRVDHLGR